MTVPVAPRSGTIQFGGFFLPRFFGLKKLDGFLQMNIQSVKIISSPTLTQSQFQNSMDKSPKILLATSQVPHLTPGQGTLPTKPVIAKDFVQREPFLRSKLGQSLKDLMALIVQTWRTVTGIWTMWSCGYPQPGNFLD